MNLDYKSAGVDRSAGDYFVQRIKQMVHSTHDHRVKEGVGGFAALYDMLDGRMLATGTDGVGTKVKLAQELGIHNTIGVDLVAMCVNDILCTGARPLFFLDYLATGKLDVEISCSIMEGIVEGCRQSSMALIGGETAEMPGVYAPGVYDLAGFAVGEVLPNQWIHGRDILPGDTLIGIGSSGAHSNGYSLLRKLLEKESGTRKMELAQQALVPTRIYCQLINKIREEDPSLIKGLAHITGSGIENIPRMNETFDYILQQWPRSEEVPQLFSWLRKTSQLPESELLRTFNMGVGLVICTSNSKKLCDTLQRLGETNWILGQVVAPVSPQSSGEIHLAM